MNKGCCLESWLEEISQLGTDVQCKLRKGIAIGSIVYTKSSCGRRIPSPRPVSFAVSISSHPALHPNILLPKREEWPLPVAWLVRTRRHQHRASPVSLNAFSCFVYSNKISIHLATHWSVIFNAHATHNYALLRQGNHIANKGDKQY